ncbi:threonine-phosphate decarboxylase CobD [Halobacterium salinarum]|uniref:threonine-phosphate decarboxylase CobD n=1 Tax=Halobacterium salinarum TaxID=2242 RepID=UPI001EEE6D11|nr:threonine-phosphate decarboxylase CobD [Halobacterium salinarum]MCF2165978.1 threonine-phosphate decarboxylase CobD [Halobacterium salinarum]MCF2167498.1 threonine-phosphate decarboxylase CobD [Halobacterium salinarum]
MHPDAVRDAGRVAHGGSDDPDVLDFSANTTPRTPPGTRAAYAAALDDAARYPDDDYPAFRAAAADHVDCARDTVVQTPGGLAGIRLAIETRVTPGDTVLVPAPSFSEYAREVELQGATPVFVPHDALLDADPSEHTLAIACTPNNPTGDRYDDDALRAFAARCRAANTELLVDEAFLGFTDAPSIAGTPGVVVARSLTKLFGLPGLRAGFLVAVGDRLTTLRTARRTWNLGAPAAAVGAHAMRQSEFVAETRRRVASERARMRAALADAFDVHPSSAPFLLLDVGPRPVDAVMAAASAEGIRLRDATTFRGLDSHVRVAVRTPDENDRLLAALADV